MVPSNQAKPEQPRKQKYHLSLPTIAMVASYSVSQVAQGKLQWQRGASLPQRTQELWALRMRVFFLSLTISASLLLLVAVMFLLFYLYYSLFHRSRTLPFEASPPPSELHRFTYKGLKSATRGVVDLGRKVQIIRREEGASTRHDNALYAAAAADSPRFKRAWKRKKKKKMSSKSEEDLFSRELSSTTSMRGTICYVAPEYGGCGYLMEKAKRGRGGVRFLTYSSSPSFA